MLPDAELKDAALHVVVEVLNGGAPEFSAKLDGVFAMKPGEVVEDLVGLAGATAGDAETDGAEVLDVGEIELGKTQLAGAEVQADGCGVKVGVQRTERRPVAAVAEAHFVDLRGTDCGQQTGRKHLHSRRRSLRELRQPRSGAEPAGRAEGEDLIALREGVARSDLFVVGNGVVQFDDEVVAIVFVAHHTRNGRRVAGRINVKDGIEARD